ncbi:MAG: hypothetical protein M2R45_03810 [Verrucomicrobia subdivision 3 bacterium]|nr:hypothetical protein [Limisphaerales bacterium]
MPEIGRPKLKGYFGVPAAVLMRADPIGNLSFRRRLDRVLPKLYGTISLAIGRLTRPPRRWREIEWTMPAIPQRLLLLNQVYNPHYKPVQGFH